MFWSELARATRGSTWWRSGDEDGCGRRLRRAVRLRTRPTSRPSASSPRRRAAASAPAADGAARGGGPARQQRSTSRCGPTTPGAAVYERHGFVPIGRRRGYYQPSGADAIVMQSEVGGHLAARSSEQGGGVSAPLVLGIETSCDETGVGIVRGNELLADAFASSVEEHARFGGVVPEVASRAHLEAMVPTMHLALEQAGVTLEQVDAIAVTAGPGWPARCSSGWQRRRPTRFARQAVVRRQPPRRPRRGRPAGARPLPQPCIALLVSGGHSSLLRCRT